MVFTLPKGISQISGIEKQKKKVYDEVTGEMVTQEELNRRIASRKAFREGTGIGQQPDEPANVPEESRRVLSPGERAAIAANAPEGMAVDKYGDLFESGTPRSLAQAEVDIGRAEASGGTSLSAERQEEVTAQKVQRVQEIKIAIAEGKADNKTISELQELEGDLSQEQAGKSALLGLLPGAAKGGATKAIAGQSGVVGETAKKTGLGKFGLGAFIAVGAIAEASNDFFRSLRTQQAESNQGYISIKSEGESYMEGLISDTNTFPENAARNARELYRTIGAIDEAHAKLWNDANNDAKMFLDEGARDDLDEFLFYQKRLRQDYINRFNDAAFNPDISKAPLNAADEITLKRLSDKIQKGKKS